MQVNTYDPSSVDIMVSGYIITGWVDVKVEWDNPPFRIVPGIRGRNTRIQNLNSSGVVTISTLQTSVSNDIFSMLLRQDELTNSARISFTLKDKSGSTYIKSDEAFLLEYPSVEFIGDDLVDRKWQIVLMNCTDRRVGGNAKPFDTVLENINKLFENF